DDLCAFPDPKKQTVAQQLIREEALQSFDLANGPLMRTRLVRLSEQEQLFLVSMHQVVCDGWSLGVFLAELVALYDAFSDREASPLPPLSIQFADFAHWQRRWQAHSEIAAQLDYWREQLRDPLPVMRLAFARTAQAADDLRTARRAIALPPKLTEAAKRF